MVYVDLAFRLTGSKFPVDHGYALYSAINCASSANNFWKSSADAKFDEGFQAATGCKPFPCQRRFAGCRELPQLVNVPTGCGRKLLVFIPSVVLFSLC